MERDLLVASAHFGYINSLSIESQDEQLMLCGGGDSAVTIWDLDADPTEKDNAASSERIGVSDPADAEPLARLDARSAHKFGISKVQWWPFDETMFLTASFDHTLKVWDTEALEEAYSFDLEHKVYSFDVNPLRKDGLVAVGLDHPHIRLADLRTSATAQTLRGHEAGSVCCVQWSPSREYMLASGGSDGLVRVWDIRRATQQVAAMDLNRTSTDQNLTPLTFRKSHRGVCNGLLWHPSGDELLSIGLDSKARVWDLAAPGGGLNKAVNFGPLFQDRRQQTLEPCFFWTREDDDELTVLLPSDTGDVLLSRYDDGALVERLVPPGREARLNRQGCVASRDGEFYSGTCDGSIVRWRQLEE